MTLATDEFIRRFLMHVLPKGLHRIRHYGLLASGNRAANIAAARELLGVPSRSPAQRSERNIIRLHRSTQGLPVAPPDLFGFRELDFLFGDLGGRLVKYGGHRP